MANTEAIDIKQKLDRGLMDMAGLISRRDYNLSLVKARQTAEQIVREYAAENRIEYTDLADTIEKLYKGAYINRTSRDALHSIRLYGNKAVHEGDNDLEDARQAYYLLKTEIQTYNSRKVVSTDRTPIRVEGRQRPSQERIRTQRTRNEDDAPVINRPEGGRNAERRHSSSQNRPARKTQNNRRSTLTIYDLLKFLIPLIALILLIILIRSLWPSKKPAETTAAPVTTEAPQTTEAPETTAPRPTETAAPTQPAVVNYKVTDGTSNVNVRLADDQSRIWTQINGGDYIGPVTEISGSDYVQFTMDGKQVVISKKFITPIQ